MAKQDHTKTAHWAMVERWNQRNDERLARMEEKRNEREKREAMPPPRAEEGSGTCVSDSLTWTGTIGPIWR